MPEFWRAFGVIKITRQNGHESFDVSYTGCEPDVKNAWSTWAIAPPAGKWDGGETGRRIGGEFTKQLMQTYSSPRDHKSKASLVKEAIDAEPVMVTLPGSTEAIEMPYWDPWALDTLKEELKSLLTPKSSGSNRSTRRGPRDPNRIVVESAPLAAALMATTPQNDAEEQDALDAIEIAQKKAAADRMAAAAAAAQSQAAKELQGAREPKKSTSSVPATKGAKAADKKTQDAE